MSRSVQHIGSTASQLWRPGTRLITSNRPPKLIESWLYDRNSLTQALKNCFGSQLGLSVVRQGWQRPTNNEAHLLGINQAQWSLIRHIVMGIPNSPIMMARSVIPRRTLSGPMKRLSTLGTRPLGEFLFSFPQLRRSAMEIALLEPGHYLFPELSTRAWGRRSVFSIFDKPILVYEVFLPELFEHLTREPANPIKQAA